MATSCSSPSPTEQRDGASDVRGDTNTGPAGASLDLADRPDRSRASRTPRRARWDPATGSRVTVDELYRFATNSLRLDFIFWGTEEPCYSAEILPYLVGLKRDCAFEMFDRRSDRSSGQASVNQPHHEARGAAEFRYLPMPASEHMVRPGVVWIERERFFRPRAETWTAS